MKLSRVIALATAGILLVGLAAFANSKPDTCLETNTGYQFCVTPELLKQLTIEQMKAKDGEYQQVVFDSGAISAATIYYTDLATNMDHILLGLYLFPEDKFDAAANPNEPPMFGQEVIRQDGKVLSVAGPQDSMFDPLTQDGKNIGALYEMMYNPDSWVK